MPSTVVHASFAFLLVAGLLGRFSDRRALVVVLAVVVFPELDTFAGWYIDGAHRALLHNYVFTAVAAVALYWETTREASWLRDRFGARGVRIVWVGLFVHTFAHLGLDWAHLDGINVFYPLWDRFFRLEGEIYLSTTEGFVQTFLDITLEDGGVVDAGQGGTTADTHVGSPVDPSPDPDPGPVDRRFPIAVRGWQAYLVAVGAFVLVAKRLQSPLDDDA